MSKGNGEAYTYQDYLEVCRERDVEPMSEITDIYGIFNNIFQFADIARIVVGHQNLQDVSRYPFFLLSYLFGKEL